MKFDYSGITCVYQYSEDEMYRQIVSTHHYMIKYFSPKRHKLIKEKTLDSIKYYCPKYYEEHRRNNVTTKR